ncbi:hypothetical protein L596_011231 [Steinernema carpocapsae]|uniref:Aminopeptidase N-like N-terminal domain-containing protein n=1 Tax=Steinernema carpocapsae TaxID=34508 RepID=A0A4U5NTR2_STECR|nr:hypothetical protein L596_011231 [Steinernema carpocapsae]
MIFEANSLSPATSPCLQSSIRFKTSRPLPPEDDSLDTTSAARNRIPLTALLLFTFIFVLIVFVFVFFQVVCPFSNVPQKTLSTSKSNVSTANRKKTPTIRLPTNNIPIHYDVTIKVFLPYKEGLSYGDLNNTIKGNAKIRLRCQKENSVIVFHVKNLIVHHDSVRIFDAVRRNAIEVGKLIPRPEAEWIEIHTKQKFRSGGEYLVLFDYSAKLGGSVQGGLYRSSYVENGKRKWMATTQMQTHDARRLLPCMDEPAMKAEFLLTVIHPVGTNAISNSEKNKTTLISR